MRRGTTPTIELNIKGIEMSQIDEWYITIQQDSVQLTKTAGLTMAAGEDTGDSDDVEHLSVSIVISGNGSATGGGRFEAGQTVTLRATPDEEATFVAWKANNASGQVLSTANPYSFTVEQNMTICAVFQGGPTPQYNIAVSADPVAGGTVSGGGTKEEGSSCTVVATPAEGYAFDGWFENGNLVSNDASYTFTVERARTLVAQFAESTEVTITVTTSAPGETTVTGGGTYQIGDQVTITASKNAGSTLDFGGWMSGGQNISNSQTYTFTAEQSMSIEASWV